MEFLKQQYQKNFEFFRLNMKKITLLTVLMFLFFIFCSAIALEKDPQTIQDLLSQFMEMASANGIVTSTGEISSIGLITNNLQACLMSISFGVIPIIFLPAISLVTNAGLIGAMFALYNMAGMSYVTLFAGLIPHGIFEFPAILLSLSLGIYLCKEITMKLFGKRKDQMLGDVFVNIVRFFLCIIVPLVMIAGFVEAYITPVIMQAFM